MATGLAHSWASRSIAPKPWDWSTSLETCAAASSTVPTAPIPDVLTKSIISRTSPPSTAICGKAATFWK